MFIFRNDIINVSYGRIGNLFGKTRSSIYDQYKNYIRGEGKNGRPPSLSEEEINLVIRHIHDLHTNPQFPVFPTFDDIQDFITNNFHKEIKEDTFRYIIELTIKDYFKTVDAKPIEVKRMEVQLNDIEENLNSLAEETTDVPLPFVFNLDEMGAQDWADACKKRVIVPSGYKLNSAPYGVERGDKPISFNMLHITRRIGWKTSICSPKDTRRYKYI